jgi:GT2 family glycosyltransferase
MDVSIVIINWNTKDILRDCLESVYEQTQDINFEVIVVDNTSADGSAEMVKNDFPQVILIENAKNNGFAAANNQGIAVAKGRYVLLLNSDTVVLDNAIKKTLSFADAHPEAAVVGCRVLNPDRTLQPSCFMFPSILNMLLSTTYLYKLFPGSRFFGREHMTWWSRDDVREVDVVTGCFMLVRREAIYQVGTMDERFFMYGEETDWCYRFKEAGWKVMFTPVGEIIHLGGASSRQTSSEMTLQLRGSILLFLKKHKSRLTYTLVCLLVSLFFFLRILYWLSASLFARSDRISCLRTARAYVTGAIKALTGGQSLCIKK